IAYQIPDKYEIETNLSGLSVKYKTEYQPTGNISYTISWVNPYGNIISSSSMISASNARIKFLTNICNKPNTHISEVFLFGFDIEHLHKAIIKAPVNPKDLNIQIVDLFHNHRFIDSSGTTIVDLESIKLNIANKAITLDYLTKNKDQQKHYTSLVRVCDEVLISHDGYRKLVVIDSNMVLLTTSDPIILYPGDKINIKIGSDGRNVGRKQSHVILAISILNEDEAVLSPKHIY
ncbi:6869_t:CDS:2, partial [Racocetra persica]